MPTPTPGIGLGLSGGGLGLLLWIADRLGLKMPDWLLITLGALAVLMLVGGVLLEVRAHRGNLAKREGRADAPATNSTFARLKGGSTFSSEGSYSSADAFFDLDEDSDATSRQDVHDPHERKRKQQKAAREARNKKPGRDQDHGRES
jgi:hypothetical protein